MLLQRWVAHGRKSRCGLSMRSATNAPLQLLTVAMSTAEISLKARTNVSVLVLQIIHCP